MNEWLAANMAQVIIAAAGFGALMRGQREQGARLSKMEEQLDELAARSVRMGERYSELEREFWAEKWPVVVSNTARIEAVEAAVSEIKSDVHEIKDDVQLIRGRRGGV